jgi:hypothetical protein
MSERGRTAGFRDAAMAPKPQRRAGAGIALLVGLLCVCGSRSAAAHETIDKERANAILAATESAAARVKSAAGSPTEAEALFALGTVQVEATATLNRDLAAHSGRLTFNGESLQKELDQRNLAPRFDDAIGRCRRLRSSRRCGSRRRHRTRCAHASSFSKRVSTRASCSIPSSWSA